MVENEQTSTEDVRSAKKHIRGSALLFSGRLLSVGLKAVMQVLIVRYLVKTDYGAFAYVMNFIEIVALLSLAGLADAASRFVPVYLEREDYDSLFGLIILSVVSIVGVGLGIMVFLIGTQSLLLGRIIGDDLTLSLLLLLIVLAPIQALDNWFQSLFAAFTEVKAIFFRRYILSPGLQLLIVFVVILSKAGVYQLSIGYLFAGIVGVLLYVGLLVSIFRRKNLWQHFHWNSLNFNFRTTYGYSFPILSSAIVYIIRVQLGTVFLEYFVNVSAVAEYRAVQPIARLNSVVYQSFVFLYLPLATRLLERGDGEGVNNLYWRTTSWIAIANFPVFIVTFALSPQLVPFLFGDQYQDASLLMSILALGYYLNALMGFNLYTVRAYSKLRYLFSVDMIVMVAIIIMYFTVIPAYGAVGAALSVTVGIALANMFNHIGMARYTDVNLFDPTFTPVYVLLLIATVGMNLVQAVFNPSLFISIPLAGVVWIFLMRANADRLQVGSMFPELLKIPFLKQLIKA